MMPGVERRWYTHGTAYHDCRWQEGVQPLDEAGRRNSRVEIDMCGLPRSVHAGVSSPRAYERSGIVTDKPPKCRLDLPLHGGQLVLSLPSVKWRPEVSDNQLASPCHASHRRTAQHRKKELHTGLPGLFMRIRREDREASWLVAISQGEEA